MRTFTLQTIRNTAAKRPPGYIEDVISHGTVEGDTVTLSDEAYQLLVVKYRGTVTPPEPVVLRQPSLMEKAANFAKSAVNHVAAGMPKATQEEVDRRFVICQGCEFLKDGACVKCGCPIVRQAKFISKLSWANEKCPVGKW